MTKPSDRRVAEAIQAAQRGDETLAFKLLVSALDMDPENGAAWYHLGLKFQAVKKYGPAAACFTKSLFHMPGLSTPRDLVMVYLNIGYNLHLAQRSREGLYYLEQAAKFDPSAALVWRDIAQVYGVLGDMEKAGAAAKTSFEIAPDDPDAVLTYAFSLFHQEKWLDGFRYFEARFQRRLPEVLTYPMPMWKGEPVDKLLLVAEQGAGDTIMMLRFVEEAAARAKKVIFLTHPSTIELVRVNVPRNMDIRGMPAPIPEADAFSLLMSLPVALDMKTLQWPKQPYVRARNKTERVPGFHVGFAWAGDPEHDTDRWRSCAIEDYLPLMELRGVVGHSLQVGKRDKDIGERGFYGLLRDLAPNITNFADTAWHIAGLDLVVTVDTAVAHLAGAMDKPVWLMVNQLGLDWRWPREGETTVWYPTMRIFRRGLDEEWHHVVARMVPELEKLTCPKSPT